MPETSKIAAKMCKAMSAVDAVVKRGKNSIQNYNYVKAADVANEVRKAMHENGVAFSYDVLSERTWDAPTKNGGLQFYCSLHVACTFTDADSGESFTARSIGWGADSQDKAPYKAMTGALKYALRMNFLIPDESDPEADEAHPEVVSRPAPVHTPQGPNVITEAQAKRFWAICNKTKKSREQVKEALGSVGVDATSDIPRDRYDELIAWAEGA